MSLPEPADFALRKRDDPSLAWSANQDELIRRRYEAKPIEALAFALDRTETAVLHRARQLGLREAGRAWPLLKAAWWMAMDTAELAARVPVSATGLVSARDLIAVQQAMSQTERPRIDPFFALELKASTADPDGRCDNGPCWCLSLPVRPLAVGVGLALAELVDPRLVELFE